MRKPKMKQLFLDISIQKKLAFTYIAAFVIPIICITFFSISRMIRISNEKSFNESQIQCNQISSNIETKLNEFYKSLYNFSSNQLVCSYFESEYLDSSTFFSVYPKVNAYLTSFRVSNPQIIDLIIYTDNETFLTNNFSIRKLTPKLLETYDTTQTQYTCMPEIVKAMDDKQDNWYLNLYRMVSFYSTPKHKTLLRITYPESAFFSLYQHESEAFSVFLVSPTGEIISSSKRLDISNNFQLNKTINTITTLSIPNNILTPSNKKYYYTHNFSNSKMLEGWNIFIEISNESYAKDVALLLMQSLLLIFLVSLLGLFLFLLCSLSISKRLNALINAMSEVGTDNNLRVKVSLESKDEIGILAKNFKKMLGRIETLIFDVYTSNLQVKDLEIKHKQAELLALQSQINPHFLFNTMQSLSISCYNNNDSQTAVYINKFCTFLRDCLYWETKCVPLSKEIEIVENYLALQQLRYVNKFTYCINIPKQYYHVEIPKFTLQPIVENAIEHGLEQTLENGFLQIFVVKKDALLQIIIKDNGIGISKKELFSINATLQEKEINQTNESIGIFNTNERLKLFYGSDFGLTLNSVLGEGTTVTISITDKGDCENVSSIIS